MNDLVLLAGSSCAAILLIDVMHIDVWMKKEISASIGKPYLGRVKPFDCYPCLSFWVCSLTGLFLCKKPVEVLFISVIASILSGLIKKQLDK